MTLNALSVNIPVKDVETSMNFFKKAGFNFREKWDERSATIIINECSYVILVCDVHFMTFTNKELTNAHKQTETVIAVEVENKKTVKQMVENALLAGGKVPFQPQETDQVYQWGFQDLDGHLWEIRCWQYAERSRKESE